MKLLRDVPSLPGRTARFAIKTVRSSARLRRLKRLGIHRIPPNFLFSHELMTSNAIVIDVGCSYQAEFSVAMIERYGARAIAVDPTSKHRSALARLADRYPDRFRHVPWAISAHNSTTTFLESTTNESGSLMPDHVNAIRDDLTRYEVTTVTPTALLEHLGLDSADILKLDIEGAEYELLRNVREDDLAPFRQIFVEFHHHAVQRYSVVDTRQIVQGICEFGYDSYSFDDHNYLFLRRQT